MWRTSLPLLRSGTTEHRYSGALLSPDGTRERRRQSGKEPEQRTDDPHEHLPPGHDFRLAPQRRFPPSRESETSDVYPVPVRESPPAQRSGGEPPPWVYGHVRQEPLDSLAFPLSSERGASAPFRFPKCYCRRR